MPHIPIIYFSYFFEDIEDLKTIAVGDTAKVCDGQERFWTVVTEINNNTITAEVNNNLIGETLKYFFIRPLRP